MARFFNLLVNGLNITGGWGGVMATAKPLPKLFIYLYLKQVFFFLIPCSKILAVRLIQTNPSSRVEAVIHIEGPVLHGFNTNPAETATVNRY